MYSKLLHNNRSYNNNNRVGGPIIIALVGDELRTRLSTHLDFAPFKPLLYKVETTAAL